MATRKVQSFLFEITQGETFSWVLTWKDSAGTLVPLPTGTTVTAKVRAPLHSSSVLFQFLSNAPGPNDGTITITDPGVLTFGLTAGQTLMLPLVTRASFDFRVVFPSGVVVVKLEGRAFVTVRQGSTR